MNLGLKGKNALITGGSHGIGRAIALALAAEGCNVAICARDKKKIDTVVRELRALGVDALGISTDVMRPAQIERAVGRIIKEWKTIHILVNNVGGGGRWGDEMVEKTQEKVWIDVYAKNALAAVRFTMKILPFMRKQKWGRVVSITSKFGKEGGGRPWFTMAKSAEMALMKTLALNPALARDGITFNTVAPGNIMIPDTGWEQERRRNTKAWQKACAESPLGRLGTPEEVAAAVSFLASSNASLINGATLAVDGGETRSF